MTAANQGNDRLTCVAFKDFDCDWLFEQQVEEVVMESAEQYWKPVWGVLERY